MPSAASLGCRSGMSLHCHPLSSSENSRLDHSGQMVGLSAGIGQVIFAFGPALLGLIRDLAGDYAPALIVCIALELAAAAIVISYRPASAKSPRMS